MKLAMVASERVSPAKARTEGCEGSSARAGARRDVPVDAEQQAYSAHERQHHGQHKADDALDEGDDTLKESEFFRRSLEFRLRLVGPAEQRAPSRTPRLALPRLCAPWTRCDQALDHHMSASGRAAAHAASSLASTGAAITLGWGGRIYSAGPILGCPHCRAPGGGPQRQCGGRRAWETASSAARNARGYVSVVVRQLLPAARRQSPSKGAL